MKPEVYLRYLVESCIIKLQTKVAKLNSKIICCIQKNVYYHPKSLSTGWYNVLLFVLLVNHQPLGGQVHELHTKILSSNLVHHSSNVLGTFVSQMWHTENFLCFRASHGEKKKM